MKQLIAEWVPWMDAYRLYDSKNPHDTFVYADDKEESEQYAKENGDKIIAYLDDDK